VKKLDRPWKDLGYLAYRWINPVADPLKLARALPRYLEFLRAWAAYSRLRGSERSRLMDTYPCIHDKTGTTSFNAHYFYQDIWAFKRIRASGAPHHVDAGSRTDFVGFLTAITRVTFIDIRPLVVELENLDSRPGDILSMPYPDGTVPSLSCLHVAEHIGLGRYGDPLDPLGTEKACRELSRILAPGGTLYFSLPVGKPRLCFNAHRVHAPGRILEYFPELKLIELSGVDDGDRFASPMPMSVLENSDYACGLFRFTKPDGP
jgi:SAM-dependent methyltransferase